MGSWEQEMKAIVCSSHGLTKRKPSISSLVNSHVSIQWVELEPI